MLVRDTSFKAGDRCVGSGAVCVERCILGNSERRSLLWPDVGRTLNVSRAVASEFRIVISTLDERQMDITEGHRAFESRAICAELIGKQLVAVGDK